MSDCTTTYNGPSRGSQRPSKLASSAMLLAALALTLAAPSTSQALTTSAMKDQTCVGYRSGNTTCAAGEFTVSPVFSAAPGTPPFCIAGGEFNFKVDLGLSGTNTDRQDIGFFVGQQGNDPRLTTPGNICSVATFPDTPSPWEDNDGDACGDFTGGGVDTITIDEIKVVCVGDSGGALQIPYVLTYWQNNGIACTGPTDVSNGAPSKCNAGVSTVSGTVAVFSGAYVDVTKQTAPDGDPQPFSFTATGPAGSKVIVLTGATLTPTSASGGTYLPATIAAATNTVTFSLRDDETARVYINALPTDQVLTITEAAPGVEWESSAAISCTSVNGAPAVVTNPALRRITASLSQANSASACTVTNTKRPRMTLVKSVASRINAGDQFTVSASGGGTLTGATSATTAGAAASASTTFYSTAGAPLTLTDAKSAGATLFSRYGARLTCTNAFAGAGATPAASLPNRLSAASYTLAPAAGDQLTCTFTNTPRPTLAKSYGTTNIAVGGSSTLTFNVSNHATMPPQADLAFTDTFPAGLTVTGVGTLSGTGCSGTPSFTPSSVSLASGAIAAGNLTCSFSATVRGDSPASYLNDNARFSGQGGGLDTGAASATLNVFTPPTAAKSFGAGTVAVGAPVSLSLILSNPAANVAPLTGVSVVDTFPAGMVLRNTSFAFAPAGCGSVTRVSGAASAAGDNNVRFFAASIAPGASCQVTLNVTSSSAGSFTNATNQPQAGAPVPLSGISATAVVNFAPQPLISILKSADRATANPGQEVIYTVELVNTGEGAGTSVVLTDDLSPYLSFFLGGGLPFTFTDSAPPSGVALGVPQYSNDNGATWAYAPVSGAGGAAVGYDARVTNWRIPMTGSIRSGGSFRINYRTMVK